MKKGEKMEMKELNKDLITQEIRNFQSASEDQQLEKIQSMKKELQESMKDKDKQEDPDNLLYSNIERANRLLDLLEERIQNKENSKSKDSISRLFEVSAQLINAITTATSSIAGGYKDELDYQYKLEQLELEHKKLAVKYALGGGNQQKQGSNVTNNNLVVTNREELLKMINESEENGEGE